ncbi:MAG: four helix bundle protein [Acidobacteria bacterium]|nr:four helix bundle protein [Acidobacteriota bacterium]
MNDEPKTMNTEKPDLKIRTKEFALRVIRLYTALPKTTEGQVVGKQLLRSGTSVGANYREATRARSLAEFISKIETALQELEETSYWLELLDEVKATEHVVIPNLRREAEELIAILVASVKTVKKGENVGR